MRLIDVSFKYYKLISIDCLLRKQLIAFWCNTFKPLQNDYDSCLWVIVNFLCAVSLSSKRFDHHQARALTLNLNMNKAGNSLVEELLAQRRIGSHAVESQQRAGLNRTRKKRRLPETIQCFWKPQPHNLLEYTNNRPFLSLALTNEARFTPVAWCTQEE